LRNNKIDSGDIIKGIGAGLCLLDDNFRIIWLNKLQSDWFGAPQQICGKHCYKIFEHRQHICLGCPSQKVFKSGTVHTAQRIGFTKDGKKRYYQLTVSPIKDRHNRVMFALELVQDITAKIFQERQNSKIMQRFKNTHKHLSSINIRLRHNVKRLKDITTHITQLKNILEKKYHKRSSQLVTLKKELQDIFKVNRTLSSTVDLDRVSSLITRLSCELMHTDACILRLVDGNKKSLMINSSYCFSDAYVKKVPVVKMGEGISGIVAQTKKPLVIEDINKNSGIKRQELIKKEGFRSILSVPVLFQNELLGVLSACSKHVRQFNEEEIEVFNIFASQVAFAVQESRHYEDIHKNYFNTIHALVLAVEARDPYTRGHTERVTKYALQIAKALKMSNLELEILRYAGEVHDIGKISIPDYILNKPARLIPAERAVVELHPVKGTEMLEPLEFLRPVILIVRHHHERYDGTGYPDGLEKERIPLLARILACADAFDAMTSQRPYRRKSLTITEALIEIKNNIGSQFDPHIANLFMRIIRTPIPIKVQS